MPTFTARTKEELRGEPDATARPGDEVPSADPDSLRYLGETGFFLYKTLKHSEVDITAPGYFDEIMARNNNAFHGALVIYTAAGGERQPERWMTGILRVVQVSGGRGVASDAPTLVATVARFGEATPIGREDEPKDGKSKAA